MPAKFDWSVENEKRLLMCVIKCLGGSVNSHYQAIADQLGGECTAGAVRGKWERIQKEIAALDMAVEGAGKKAKTPKKSGTGVGEAGEEDAPATPASGRKRGRPAKSPTVSNKKVKVEAGADEDEGEAGTLASEEP